MQTLRSQEASVPRCIVIAVAALAMSLLSAAAVQAASDDEVEELRRRIEQLERERDVSAPESAPAEAEPVAEQADAKPPGEDDETGTDPRAFGSKFMPYYRYDEMRNGLRINSFTLFGMFRFSDDVAMTYELPVAQQIDYSSVRQFKAAKGLIGNQGGGAGPSNSIPPVSLDSDGDEVGMGDLNLRFFYRLWIVDEIPSFPWKSSFTFMPIMETTVPSATQDVLGSEAFILSPGFATVIDSPLPPGVGFIAMMNFYDVDAFVDESRGHVSRYRGRWFLMQPLTPPDKGPLLGGWYLLPEFQPVYDFLASEFSFWIGPEIGKMLAEGRIIYAKPGWGISPRSHERKITFETGFRWFF
jgi:hypothetical protein